MYESFYKLHPTPFRLTPDPHFFFESDTHKRGLAYLRFAFYQQEGFVVITGAPGTGKTELMLNLIDEMPHNKVTLAKIVTSNLDADDLLDLVAASFLIDPEHFSKGSLLKRLEDYFLTQSRKGKQVLLLIDEAHNLSVKSLIELSMLSNFQVDEKPLLQCFLLGQEPLEEKLRLPELVHLKQRVIASTHLENLNPQETRDYILHRLVRSGWNNNPIIRDTAFALIHFYTKGIPRRINSMCNRIFLQAFLENRNDIGADLVHQVIEELQEEVAEEHVDLDVDFSGLQENIAQSSAPEINNTQQDDEQVFVTDSTEHVLAERQDSSNVINIPEFIRKKESARTDHESLNSEINTTSSQYEPIVSLKNNNSQINAKAESSAIQSKETSVESRITEHTKLDSKKDETQDLSPVESNAEDHNATSRPSGLLDKELQFLASLNDSSAPPKIAKKSDKPDHTPKEKDSHQASVKKVIIDESVSDDYGINDPNVDDSNLESSAETADEKHHWQPAVLAIAILIGISFSIYWQFNGSVKIIPQTAGIKSETSITDDTLNKKIVPDTIVANNLPDTKNALTAAIPEMPIPAPVFPSLSDKQLKVKAQAQTDPANTQANTKLAAVTLTSSEKMLPPQNPDTSSATEDTPGIDKLDQQVTVILEKPGIETNTENATANTQLIKPIKLEPGVTLAEIENANTNPEPASVSTEVKETDSPLVGSPVTELSDHIKPAREVDTRYANTSIAQMPLAISSMPARSTNQNITKTKVKPFISNDDLRTLLFNLSTAYEMGNLQQLVRTFASDISSSDGSTRKQLENDYQRLFDITDTRRLAIRDVKWLKKDKQMLGDGDFQVQIREKGATNYTTYEGKISFTVAKESNNVVIKRLDYDYNN